MDRLKQRLEMAQRAIASMSELDKEPYSKIVRDAAIQRFEYTFEVMWKTAQLYLKEIEGIEIVSPKAAIRGCFQTGILTEVQTQEALAMADDRNLTSHTYNESLAQQIYSRMKGYKTLMQMVLVGISSRLENQARDLARK